MIIAKQLSCQAHDCIVYILELLQLFDKNQSLKPNFKLGLLCLTPIGTSSLRNNQAKATAVLFS